MISTQSNLTMIGLNTPTPQVFWKGSPVKEIKGIRTDWELDEQRIRIKVSLVDVDTTIITEMRAAGIVVKEV